MEETRRSTGVNFADFLHGEGIDLFGSLPVQVLPVTKERLLSRVPKAQTAVFFAVPYLVRKDGERESNLSLYARSRDYHLYAKELEERMRTYWRERFPQSQICLFADHSPFAEVTAAAMAGLGVLGDNGLLITEKYGSFVFLAEALTDLSVSDLLAEAIPQGTGKIRTCPHCGACSRACVGHCLPTADRTNCLSAITQKKGDLSPEEQKILATAETVWGCDVCQNVCPLNRTATETPILFFREERLSVLTEENLVAMTDELYQQYAFSWRKREILLRNICVKLTVNEGEHS